MQTIFKQVFDARAGGVICLILAIVFFAVSRSVSAPNVPAEADLETINVKLTKPPEMVQPNVGRDRQPFLLMQLQTEQGEGFTGAIYGWQFLKSPTALSTLPKLPEGALVTISVKKFDIGTASVRRIWKLERADRLILPLREAGTGEYARAEGRKTAVSIGGLFLLLASLFMLFPGVLPKRTQEPA